MKRLFDIFCSLFGIIILSPILLIISIGVLLSKGPILYTQTRVGKNNIDFSLFKFRTMYTDSDKKGLLTVGGRDPRITAIGYYLRKYKFDELPQLVNVLIGDMSLVGPRPEVRKYVDMYNDIQKGVLNVRPGITDYASIKFRNESDLLAKADNPEKYYIEEIMPQKLSLNLEYINNNNVFKDITIIFETFKAIIGK